MDTQPLEGFACLDCGQCTYQMREYYMVRDKVWCKAVPELVGMVCIKDLETRLGRALRADDFTDCPLNTGDPIGFPKSALLKKRLASRN